MNVEFEKEYLAELYEKGKTDDKKHRFQPQVIRNYVKRIVTLAEALNVEALYPLNSLNYEVLTGSKKDISSINTFHRPGRYCLRVSGVITAL